MKTRNVLFLLATALLLASCATPNLTYLSDQRPGNSNKVLHDLEIRIRPGDKLSIIVNSRDPALMNLFSLPYVQKQMGSTTTASSGSGTVSTNSQGTSGYTVYQDGTIDFPVMGHIEVAGMTREEIARYIKEELILRNLVKDPVVTVEFMNLTFSVLGEVGAPGRYSIDKDQITLLDAISMAGDLTIYGQRENVLVQREENGKKTLYEVDLTSGADLYASEVYYLQQDDIVYVEPSKMKARQATVNGNNMHSVSFWMSLASFVASMIVLIAN